MNVVIILTTAGSDTGPFDLYSNLDNYLVPFETNVSKSALLLGYSSALVPDGSLNIKVKSANSVCASSINLSLEPLRFNNTITTLNLSSTDGTFLLVGNFTTMYSNGITYSATRVSKMSYIGRIDEEFNNNVGSSIPSVVYSHTGGFVAPNGKIFVTGLINSFNGSPVKHIVALNENGTINTDFNQGSGFSYFTTRPYIEKDNSFIYVPGIYHSYRGKWTPRLAKIDFSGNVVNTFYGGGNNTSIEVVEWDADNVLIHGYFESWNGFTVNNMIVLNKSTGARNPAFSPGIGPNIAGNDRPMLVDIDYVGQKIYVSGCFTKWNNISRNYITRLNMDGSLDETFVVGTGFNRTYASYTDYYNPIKGIMWDVDENKLVLSGIFSTYNGQTALGFVRLNPDGSLDSTFNYTLANAGWHYDFDKYLDHYYIAIEDIIRDNGSVLIGKVAMNGDGRFL